MVTDPIELTPTQQRLLDQLRRAEPVVFDESFVTQLVERAEAALARASERLGGLQLRVTKHWLVGVHGCEVRHVSPEPFRWSVPAAKGFVAHKAIELGAHWQGAAAPAVLVDEALARLADEASQRGDFVAGLTEAERAELRCFATERATRFLQDFPPIPVGAHPTFEASTRWEPHGTVVLSGKTDLVVGRPHGRESTKLIIDFKSGGRATHHRDDLRFYALLETMVRKVPPRRLVTYYLESCEADTEDVTEGVLEAALARVEGALARHAELALGERPPERRVGGGCRWCHVLATCDEGRAHLRALDDDGSQGFD